MAVDDLYLHIVPVSREHMVGSVDRHGQQNAIFAMLVDLAKQFEVFNEASFSMISKDIILCYTYELLGRLDLQIW